MWFKLYKLFIHGRGIGFLSLMANFLSASSIPAVSAEAGAEAEELRLRQNFCHPSHPNQKPTATTTPAPR